MPRRTKPRAPGANLGLTPSAFRQEYEFLKEASLEVWVGQFLIRNNEFMNDCLRLHTITPDDEKTKAFELCAAAELARIYGAFPVNWHQVITKQDTRLDIKLIPGVRGIRVINSCRRPEIESLLERRRKAYEANDLDIVALFSIRDATLTYHGADETATLSDKLPAMDYLMGGEPPRQEADFSMRDLMAAVAELEVRGTPGQGPRYQHDDILLLAVDLNRPRDEIMKRINQYLDIHLIADDFRKLKQKWMMYLMVFDLIVLWEKSEQGAAEILQDAFPEHKRREKPATVIHRKRGRPRTRREKPRYSVENIFEEPQTIKDYLREAKKLISGNYRKYIIFSQRY